MSKFKFYKSPTQILLETLINTKKLMLWWYRFIRKHPNYAQRELMWREKERHLKTHAALILGGLAPFRYISKDFRDTFKPYKINTHVLRDLFQPLRGIGNILKGVIDLILLPLVFIIKAIACALYAFKFSSFSHFKKHMARNFFRTLGALIEGPASILRGGLQIITTPLTWILRVPLRRVLTCLKGYPSLGDSLQTRVADLRKTLESYQSYQSRSPQSAPDPHALRLLETEFNHLYIQFFKAQARGQKTLIPLQHQAFQGDTSFIFSSLSTSDSPRNSSIDTPIDTSIDNSSLLVRKPMIANALAFLKLFENDQTSPEKAGPSALSP